MKPKNIPEHIEKYGLDKLWSDKDANFYYEFWQQVRSGEMYFFTGDKAWAVRISKRYNIPVPTKEKASK
jgi:hypothetical protein